MSAQAKILVVDDEPAIRKIVALRGKQAGFASDFAADGLEAWQHAASIPYHLIITDYQMPKMDGIQLCTKLRTSKRNKETPIIMITAMAGELDTESMHQQLDVIVLQKPNGFTDLADLIQQTAKHPQRQ